MTDLTGEQVLTLLLTFNFEQKTMRNQSPKHQYIWEQFHRLKSLYRDYLEHRIGHQVPHATFKRYLVSRNERFYSDLFDDYRHGRTQFPSIWLEQMTFAFTTCMSNEGIWGRGTYLTEIR